MNYLPLNVKFNNQSINSVLHANMFIISNSFLVSVNFKNSMYDLFAQVLKKLVTGYCSKRPCLAAFSLLKMYFCKHALFLYVLKQAKGDISKMRYSIKPNTTSSFVFIL